MSDEIVDDPASEISAVMGQCAEDVASWIAARDQAKLAIEHANSLTATALESKKKASALLEDLLIKDIQSGPIAE